MPFRQNIALMKQLWSNVQNSSMYSNYYSPAPNNLPSLVLLYPGKLSNSGDYRLEFNGQAFSHTDIVQAVYDATLNGHGLLITDFLVDLYKNGLNANSKFNININIQNISFSLDEFKYLVYWLVLQEDINYPRPRFKGVKMPLTRYIEGAVAAVHPNLLSLQAVFSRTNNHGGPPPSAFAHPLLTPYLTHNLGQII